LKVQKDHLTAICSAADSIGAVLPANVKQAFDSALPHVDTIKRFQTDQCAKFYEIIGTIIKDLRPSKVKDTEAQAAVNDILKQQGLALQVLKEKKMNFMQKGITPLSGMDPGERTHQYTTSTNLAFTIEGAACPVCKHSYCTAPMSLKDALVA